MSPCFVNMKTCHYRRDSQSLAQRDKCGISLFVKHGQHQHLFCKCEFMKTSESRGLLKTPLQYISLSIHQKSWTPQKPQPHTSLMNDGSNSLVILQCITACSKSTMEGALWHKAAVRHGWIYAWCGWVRRETFAPGYGQRLEQAYCLCELFMWVFFEEFFHQQMFYSGMPWSNIITLLWKLL